MQARRPTPADCGAAFLRLLLAALLWSAAITAQAQLYLRHTGVPLSTLTVAAPTATTLTNFDPGRDSAAGLQIAKGGSALNESDSTKFQTWVIAAGGTVVSGTPSLTIWAAIKEFNNSSKRGVMTAYLADCNSGGTGCTQIASATINSNPWSGTNGWVQKTVNFSSASYTIPAGRHLALKIIVTSASDDDMWFAYDTTTYASRIDGITIGGTPPGGFNAFETSTAAGAITGVIRTKIAGSAFSLAVVALNPAETAVLTSFTGTVTVDLLDASNNSGALDGATGCRSSWTTMQTVSPNPAFASGDSGRINVAFTVANAWREVRVRVTYSSGGTTTVGCSTDNFAIRPASFASVQALDADDATPGLARSLNNSAATSGVVHRAGRAFTVLGQAVSSTGAVTSGYDGTPQLVVAACVVPAGCSAGTLSSSLAGSGGVVTGTATYAEAGVITARLEDIGFTAVDAGDSTPAERTIASSAANVGRFVPDAYQLTVSAAPQFVAPLCAAGPSRQGFGFVGQPFSFGTAPVVLATPLNASGAALANARPRYAAAQVSNSVSAAGAPVSLSGATAVAGITHGATSLIAFDAGSFAFDRGATPVASFTPTLSMTVNLADTTENGTAGNTTIHALAPLTITPIDFADAAGTFHYGRAWLRPSYGDVRRELYAPLEVQRFNGLGWIALTEMGACLTAPPTAFAYANATGLLDAGGGASNCASRINGTVATAGGRAAIRLDKPGGVTTTQPSAMTMTLNLLGAAAGLSCSGASATPATTVNAPWLAGADGSNPSARLTWGRSRGELLGLRERFD